MYNERENIALTLEAALEVIPRLGLPDWEILVVDDGSRDGSADVVRAFAADPRAQGRLRLVSHGVNRGYGRALATGFRAARHELVFYTDSDLPVDLGELSRALQLIDGADLVAGYRKERHETRRRWFYSRVYHLLMAALFGVRVRDVNFSFKLIRRRALAGVRLEAKSVFIDGELLAEVQRGGARMVEMGLEYLPRKHGVSSFDSPKAALLTFGELMRYRLARALGLR